MAYSMASHNRRKHQRWFNRYCRYINKNLEADDLWLGRFYVTQDASEMEWFEDGSGGSMRALITMHDHKTGITRSKWYHGIEMDWKFWWDLNSFIIDDCKVWKEEPDVRENRIDYRGVR